MRKFLTLALLVFGLATPAVAEPQTGAAQLETRATAPHVTRRASTRSHAVVQPQRRQSVQRASAARNTTGNYRRWINYGVDKSYNTRAEAIADAANVMRQGGWSDRVAREMQRVMETEACERFELENGHRADNMRSGGARPGSVRQLWGPTIVAFHQPTNMTLRAPACRWTRTIDGIVYTVELPDVCFNTLLIRGDLDCVLIDEDASHVQTVGMLYRTYEDDQCLGVRRISRLGEPEPANAHYGPLTSGGCAGDCTLAFADVVVGRLPVRSGLHAFGPGKYRIRVRREQILAICILTPGGDTPSSFGNIVWWQRHYVPFGRTWLATVHAVPRNGADVRNTDYLVNWGRNEAEVAAIYERPIPRYSVTGQVVSMR